MKDVLKRMLGKVQEPVQAVADQVAPEAVTAVETVLADTAVLDVETLQAALETKNTEIAAMASELAAARDKIAELAADVSAAVEFNAARAQEALEAKLTARKEKIVAAVGTEKADALMAATASMEDVSFEAVVSAMTTTQTTEATTALFTEVGVEAEVDKSKLAADKNPVMDYLTAKYKQTN